MANLFKCLNIISLTFLLSSSCFYGQNPDFKNLDVQILKVEDRYSIPQGSHAILSSRGSFKMIQLVIKNTGKPPINLNFKNVFALDKLGNRYPIYFLKPFPKKKKKLKGNRNLKKTLYFDFPHNHEPVMILIEDRKFQLYF
ncbi:hypothetical protein EV196_102228 [Mariniflexile fucanivorans]|uniref:DUF4352 domain-containing protein n=1 Tax=Mariniflexile fucanivorans TaxID=264023 RepID=A0A4R1RMZ7_9FLAO|nr:hypothetical protein [Mariniflexile fucanivorans]TCL67668.1 hypothetical protein EV196_102228 [Mariniflexile fucanivorans]